MAAVEIDETELVALRNNSSLLSKALANPKAREQVLRGLKAANPDLPIPELDARAPMMEELEGFGKTLKDMRDEMKADKEAREQEKSMAKLQSQWGEGRSKVAKQGYAGESLEALEKFMEEKGIADHECAAAAFEKMHPQTKPIEHNTGKFDFFARKIDDNDALQKKLWTNDPSFVDDATDQILREIRSA